MGPGTTGSIGRRSLAVAILATTLVSSAFGAAPVSADGKVALGGGAVIAVNGGLCTLTTIGTDGSGELVGFTSRHCGGPGAQVATAGGPAVGSVVAGDAGLDYAVIKFDPAAVTPIPDFDGFAINGLGPAPAFFQRVCEQGRTSGNKCFAISSVQGPDPGTILADVCGQPGDDGAPVTLGGELVGMMHGGFPPQTGTCPEWITSYWYHPLRYRPQVVSFPLILDDVNTKGGPGTGFTPVGG